MVHGTQVLNMFRLENECPSGKSIDAELHLTSAALVLFSSQLS